MTTENREVPDAELPLRLVKATAAKSAATGSIDEQVDLFGKMVEIGLELQLELGPGPGVQWIAQTAALAAEALLRLAKVTGESVEVLADRAWGEILDDPGEG